MTIEYALGVLEDLRDTMQETIPEPMKTEICTALQIAINKMNDDYNGMLKYEQICEEILLQLGISDAAKTFFQVMLLDEAQRRFEVKIKENANVEENL